MAWRVPWQSRRHAAGACRPKCRTPPADRCACRAGPAGGHGPSPVPAGTTRRLRPGHRNGCPSSARPARRTPWWWPGCARPGPHTGWPRCQGAPSAPGLKPAGSGRADAPSHTGRTAHGSHTGAHPGPAPTAARQRRWPPPACWHGRPCRNRPPGAGRQRRHAAHGCRRGCAAGAAAPASSAGRVAPAPRRRPARCCESAPRHGPRGAPRPRWAAARARRPATAAGRAAPARRVRRPAQRPVSAPPACPGSASPWKDARPAPGPGCCRSAVPAAPARPGADAPRT
jgi:hypothetical protein